MAIIGCVLASHAPFWDCRTLEPFGAGQRDRGVGAEFLGALATLRDEVAEADPSAVVVVGPDHHRNFFYDAQPSWCVGIDELHAFGDFGTGRDNLVSAASVGRDLVTGFQHQGFDPAVSLRMGLDHGIVQLYTALVGDRDVPLVPIMVTCNGPAMMPPRRAVEVGTTLGAVLAGLADERVLVVASGGLAHWTPSLDPDDPALAAEMRDYVVAGRERAREVDAIREQGIANLVATLDETTVHLEPEWDRAFIDLVVARDLDALGEMNAAGIGEAAGNGGQEVRTWMVGAAAWDGPLEGRAYEAVGPWLTGMGCVAGFA